MTLRKIHTESNGPKTAKVYRDSKWQEFRVRLYINGKLNAPADYHTEGKADAIAMAAVMVLPCITAANIRHLTRCNL